MQFIDLKAQQLRIRDKIESGIQTVLDHGRYVNGPEIAELERKLAAYVGVDHAVACGSGTDALLLALMSHGVGPGDAVFTSPFTFIATAEVLSLLGATPVFVDIHPATFNMDPDLLAQAVSESAEGKTPATKAKGRRGRPLVPKGIIGVDLFGLPADYGAIHRVADRHGLFVIEDAAQSFGGEQKGKKACSLAEVACTSFFPAKPLGCYGDGGMCFAQAAETAALVRSLREHGMGEHKYDNDRIGINGRMDSFQAAVLLAKFDIFPEELTLRERVAARYSELIAPIEGLTAPDLPPDARSAWAQYSLVAKDKAHRTRLLAACKDAGIPTAIYYPKPLHLQKAFEVLGYGENDFPISEDVSRRIFSLPMHPYVREADQVTIAGILAKAPSPVK
jgi:dTDP-4-amino-4,6-dideoxygalactose transaminase